MDHPLWGLLLRSSPKPHVRGRGENKWAWSFLEGTNLRSMLIGNQKQTSFFGGFQLTQKPQIEFCRPPPLDEVHQSGNPTPTGSVKSGLIPTGFAFHLRSLSTPKQGFKIPQTHNEPYPAPRRDFQRRESPLYDNCVFPRQTSRRTTQIPPGFSRSRQSLQRRRTGLCLHSGRFSICRESL